MQMSKTQKWLLALSLAVLILAEIAKRLAVSEKTAVIIGAIEVILALAAGAAFGLAATKAHR